MRPTGSTPQDRDLLKRLQPFPHGFSALAGYTLALSLGVAVLIRWQLAASWLHVYLALVLLASVAFEPRLYLVAQGLLVVALLVTAYAAGDRVGSALPGIVLTAACGTVLSEILHRLMASRFRREARSLAREQFLVHLTDITQAALETSDLPALLALLAERLAELFDADGCRIMLWDQETQTATLAAEHEQRPGQPVQDCAPSDVTAITAAVLNAGRPLVVSDLPDMLSAGDGESPLPATLSLLGLPLVADEQPLGAALIVNHQPYVFTADEVARGKQVSALASLALAKARLVDELAIRAADLGARNTELDTYAHTVAHDLKAPLSWIVGYAETLALGYSGLTTAERQHHLEIIAQSGRKMSSIIDELLLFSSLSSIEKLPQTPLDMDRIVKEAFVRLSSLVSDGHVVVHLPDTWPVAVGYAPWVEEVWTNYLSNAIKYGGQPPCLILGAETDGDTARFWVQDNGDGISPEQQTVLFTPYTRLDNARGVGYGLGLSIARRIMEKLGGSVAVESRVGEGSRFSFTLRLADTGQEPDKV